MSAYKSSGVDIALGDEFSEYCGKVCTKTFNANPYIDIQDFGMDENRGHFRGVRGIVKDSIFAPKGVHDICGSDGVGTKTIICTAASNQRGSARDMAAMLFDDAARYGAMPYLLTNDLSVDTLGRHNADLRFLRYKQMMDELGLVAKENHVVLFGGETAELSHCVTSEIHSTAFDEDDGSLANGSVVRSDFALTKYNWSGSLTSFLDPKRVINGKGIKKGDIVVSLREPGMRSNGASMMRRYLREKFGTHGFNWWQHPDAQEVIDEIATPATIYTRFLTYLNGWHNAANDFEPIIKVKLIAHISGGGVKSKFADVLMSIGYSAALSDLHEPANFLRDAVTHFGLSSAEAYETFSSGNGALLVISPDHFQALNKIAGEFGIEVTVSGEITAQGGEKYVQIFSKYDGTTFSYKA